MPCKQPAVGSIPTRSTKKGLTVSKIYKSDNFPGQFFRIEDDCRTVYRWKSKEKGWQQLDTFQAHHTRNTIWDSLKLTEEERKEERKKVPWKAGKAVLYEEISSLTFLVVTGQDANNSPIV